MKNEDFRLPRQTFEELVRRLGAKPVLVEFTFDDHDVRIGTDDFSITAGQGKILFASGNIRGLFYAVYEYFERFCSCRWFWDGDILPERKILPTENIRYVKKFRMPYRGLRYFAHRSLYRFQAEHWDFDDWKKEINFLLKKHFSFFMLRTGQDDIFQKTFPDIVPYPPADGPAPEAEERSYNDRTELLSLEYRGELRKKVLDYAFERGLMHPEDMGPMTHWYSHTPRAFLDHFKPKFMVQSSDNYARRELQVWDCFEEANIERYMELTRAHIRHYGKGELFHIIGLAERVFGSPEENLETKIRVLRSFIRKLREEYPHAPLLIASWDFMFRWKAPEVRRLLAELDPVNTLILDYTTDSDSRSNNFLSWGLPHHFPWIFGIFQAYEPQNDLFFDFDRADEMFAPVRDDPQCRGMVIWSENSHSNPLLLEYLAKKSADEPFSREQFCRDRYGRLAGPMDELWQLPRTAFACNSWVFGTERPYQGICCNHFNLLDYFACMRRRKPAELFSECARKYELLDLPDSFFGKAAAIASVPNLPEMVRRDLADLVRSALMCRITRELCRQTMKITGRHPEKPDGILLHRLIAAMGDLLAVSPEFSLNVTLERTARAGKLNSHADMTLKGNAENGYCRSYIYELYRAVYEPEAACLQEHLDGLEAGAFPDPEYLNGQAKKIRDSFYETPLAAWRPDGTHSPAEVLHKLAETPGIGLPPG
ncbi:MAG: hypothetical protein J5944_03880 [Lentisphaeria bacterium]|nr:hypothetical protein [Lentisphaeria bacterium]